MSKVFLKYYLVLLLMIPFWVSAQLDSSIPLNDLSAFKPTNKTNWQLASVVSADLSQNEILNIKSGAGVLVNLPDKENRANLVFGFEHGDIDIEFDFMMATHSNSGFYLQGRYELQLLDSWGVKNPYSGDCGGIYQRRRLPDRYMYEGHAPRQNACKAPGLWQHMMVSFQAPKFNAAGQKISNAKFLKVILNGVLIQENVECTGPTGGPISETEAANGPIMIQGDHGAVAFRNINYNNFDKTAPVLSNLNYTYWDGKYKMPTDFVNSTATKTAKAQLISWDVSPTNNNFALKYTGTLSIKIAGKYRFNLPAGGSTLFKLDGKEILKNGWTFTTDSREVEPQELSIGDHTFEYLFWKTDGWMAPALGLNLAGPGIRQTSYHSSASVLVDKPAAPIYMEAKENTNHRSFVDYKGVEPKRIVHAINVGSNQGVHFSMDLDKGSVFHAWRGQFLDCSPMWDNRGDGSSRPMGALVAFANHPVLGNLVNENTPMLDTLGAGANYRFKGYDLNASNQPTFRYNVYGANVEDETRPDASGKYLIREVRLAGSTPPPSLGYLLATAKNIEALPDNLYAINDKEYYIKVLEGRAIMIQPSANNKAQLIVPATGKVKYALMW
jgi:hypothetical protein